jgi:hypothetical protein
MHIKKFTQFIIENEYYDSINEGDIVPGVAYNSASQRENNTMSVISNPEKTEITFMKNSGADAKARVILSLCFPAKPLSIYDGQIQAYAYVLKDTDNSPLSYPAAVTKMEDFSGTKSAKPLYRGSDSIDLLAEFIASGISDNATAGSNLAKVIAKLLLDTGYKDKVTDTFKKFANSIIMNVRNQGFIIKMSQDFVAYKQSPGMKAFVAELPKSCDALSPKKA